MAHVLNDRVKETTTSTGTGTIDLAGADAGFESFVSAIGNSNTTYYAIAHQSSNEFEIGIGTVTDASPDTLSRTTVISSTNSDSLVDFSAGTKDVFCTLPASKAVFFDESSGSSDVAIGSRGTNPLALGITGTVLAVSEASDVASVQIDGVTGTRIDMGTSGSRNAVFFTDATQLEISRTTDHPIKFKVNSSETARLTSSGMQFAAGKDISNASGSMTIDVADNLSLDVDGGNIALKDAGTQWGNFANNSSDFDIDAVIQDKDIKFNGNDGGSSITAGFFDMSDAGRLNVNGGIDLPLGTDIEANYGDWTGEKSAKLQFHGGHFYIQTTNSLYFRNYNNGNGDDKISFDNGGNIVAEGNVTAYGSVSDERLKENIKVIDNAVDKVKQLKGITFNYKKDGKEGTGLIAQDLEKVLPEAVYTAKTLGDHLKDEKEEEHLAINYGNTVGLLVEAIKEQQKQIDTLNDYVKLQSATIMDMERRLNELEDK